MASNPPTFKTVAQLTAYLRERGISCAKNNKAALEELVAAARQLDLEVDPDGILEDREPVIREKLSPFSDKPSLASPETLDCESDLSQIPNLSTIDIFVYLQNRNVSAYAGLREHKKTEA